MIFEFANVTLHIFLWEGEMRKKKRERERVERARERERESEYNRVANSALKKS